MNYIQRLLDTGAAPNAGPPAGLTPPVLTESPLMAADQRLGVFPDLFDPFGQSGETLPEDGPAPDDGGAAPETDVEAPPPTRAEAPSVPPRQRAAALSPSDPRPEPPAREASDAGAERSGETGADPAPPPHPLQRLIEQAPLPPPRTEHPVPSAEAQAEPPQPRPASEPPPQAASPAPAPEAASPIPRGLAEITPDQFTPAEPAPPPPPEPRPAPAVETAAAPEAAPRPAPEPRPAPAEPAADLAPSPLAGVAEHQPLPPPPRAAPDPPSPVPERIVERIREVPVERPAPPKPMTAAAQSVIGPLAQRRSFGWRPRQGGV